MGRPRKPAASTVPRGRACTTRPMPPAPAGQGGRSSTTTHARCPRPPQAARATRAPPRGGRGARGPQCRRPRTRGSANCHSARGRAARKPPGPDSAPDAPTHPPRGPPEAGNARQNRKRALDARSRSTSQTSGRSGRLGGSAVSVVPSVAAGAREKGRGQSAAQGLGHGRGPGGAGPERTEPRVRGGSLTAPGGEVHAGRRAGRISAKQVESPGIPWRAPPTSDHLGGTGPLTASVPGLFLQKAPAGHVPGTRQRRPPTRGREGTGERPAGEVGRGAEWGVAEWPVFSGWVGALGTGFRAPLGQGGRRREPTAEVRPPGGGKGWAENAQNFSGGRDLTPDSSMTQILGCLRAAVKSGANPGKEMGVVSSRPPLRGVILGKSEPCQVLQRNHLLSRASRS